jgi:3-oxoacyl-[acyl-carrier-protein] synthase II
LPTDSASTSYPFIKARITGIGWVNASGSGRGRCDTVSNWAEGTPTVPASILSSIKGGSRFGRLDLFSQIGVAAIGLALQDAGLLHEHPAKEPENNSLTGLNPETTGLICATTSSCSLTDHNFFNTIKDEPHLASPGLFVYTLATSFLGEAALRFSLTGLTMAVIEPRPRAADAICIAIEELVTGDDEIIVTGLCNLFAEASPTPQGSGALFLVLEKDTETDIAPKKRTYATLSCNPQTDVFYCNNQPCPDIFSLCKMICG